MSGKDGELATLLDVKGIFDARVADHAARMLGKDEITGADADGGAADIAGAPRIGAPTPPVPPVIPALSVTVSGLNLIFAGQAAAAKVVDVQYEVNDDGVARHVAGIAIPIGTSAGAAAAIVAGRCNSSAHLTAAQTSNEVRLGAKSPNVIGADPVLCTIT